MIISDLFENTFMSKGLHPQSDTEAVANDMYHDVYQSHRRKKLINANTCGTPSRSSPVWLLLLGFKNLDSGPKNFS